MDHETTGAQEWLLPGYGRAPPKRMVAPQTTQQPIRAPQNVVKPHLQKQPVRGHFRARGRGGFKVTANPRGNEQPSANNLFRDSPSKSQWRNGQENTGAVKLPAAFGTFKHEFFGAARSAFPGKSYTRPQDRNEVFDEISQRTGAYVKPPLYYDQVVRIWGEPPQVAAAAEIVGGLVVKCNMSKPKKRDDWTKIKSYSVNKEASAELKEKREIMLQQLRKQPDPSTTFPEQLLFLWPNDGPSMIECFGPQLEDLDIIRAKFGCHIFVPKDLPRYICALGYTHDLMGQIAQLIRTRWGEIVAKSNVKRKVYIVEPPTPSTMKGKIAVEKHVQLHRPALRGSELKGSELENWKTRATLIRSKNNSRLLSAVEGSLKGVAFVRGHLRMRINLGLFVLENYQKPGGDKDWYEFEEFREILLHEQTKGRLIPGLKIGQSELLERCFKATNLLEPYDSTSDSLKSAELAYSVNFEFLGTDKSMLRLEAEFAKSPGAQDYEITQRRWLRPHPSGQFRDNHSPLHIGVIDFGRSDWQLEIKSLEFHETSSIDAALKVFSHSIGFRRTAGVGDISAKPERKVTFPASAPVSRFVEKSALRYQLKGTKYIFEVARYDEYSRSVVPAFPGQSPATVPGEISDVPFTCWSASVFHPNWDNLLGGHANLSVGHSAKYKPNLDTFFPPTEVGLNDDDRTKGFWKFIDLVNQVAELLGPAKTIPPENTHQPRGNVPAHENSSPMGPDSAKKGYHSTGIPSTPSFADPSGLLNADLGTLF
ncbi:hypothetical protein ARAM_005384 [Aspergillus rambellii]|uniref:DUF7905 domain-containing protein n=1 Tax=Aspergillus rambellii TaxID=308745 RepID=A0A0F8WQR9_9EURO|nr:hypothetical protein ARAM_005384 [Aspergillus rambellii]